MKIKVTLTPDKDGFITQQCKNNGCHKEFKVAFGHGSSETISYCPYCNYHGQFWTPEQMKYLDCMAEHPDQPELCTEPVETAWANKEHQFKCNNGHKDRIKYKGVKKDFFCIICGQ
ncbi:MAG TPA: hypothetical protein VGX70_01920 [Gemmataceae bacterium]|nr:hypothetical protein [Gemmataceae bacterium]